MNATLWDRLKTLITGKRKIIRHKDTGSAFARYRKSLGHAIDGIVYALVCEHNMIIILLAIIVVTFAGFFLHISSFEWLFCIGIIGAVAASECINTAVEAVADLASPDINPLAKIAKDTASSATLILSVTAFIGSLIIFLPKIIALF